MKYMEDVSKELGLTRNMIRYLDKDTMEVDADNDIKFITYAVNLEKVQQYQFNIKTKKEKDG
jgi:cell division septal protein FtsQ